MAIPRPLWAPSVRNSSILARKDSSWQLPGDSRTDAARCCGGVVSSDHLQRSGKVWENIVMSYWKQRNLLQRYGKIWEHQVKNCWRYGFRNQNSFLSFAGDAPWSVTQSCPWSATCSNGDSMSYPRKPNTNHWRFLCHRYLQEKYLPDSMPKRMNYWIR